MPAASLRSLEPLVPALRIAIVMLLIPAPLMFPSKKFPDNKDYLRRLYVTSPSVRCINYRSTRRLLELLSVVAGFAEIPVKIDYAFSEVRPSFSTLTSECTIGV